MAMRRARSNLWNSRGFTLIELMIVVAIIAILAALAIPAYRTYVIQSQISEGLSLVNSVRIAIWDYYTQHGKYPSSNSEAGIVSANSMRGNYVQQISITSSNPTSSVQVTITYGGKAAQQIQGKQLLFVGYANTSGDNLTWTCQSGTGSYAIPSEYLPPPCR